MGPVILSINMPPNPEDEVTDAAAAATEETKTEETTEAAEAVAAEPEAKEEEAVEEKKERGSKRIKYPKSCHQHQYINQQIISKRWCFYSTQQYNPTEKKKIFHFLLNMKKTCHTS